MRAWSALATRFVAALLILSVTTIAGYSYAYWYANDQIVHHTKVAPIKEHTLTTVESSTDPANYLIVGSDSRAFVNDAVAADKFGDKQSQSGQRSDTIMIAHVDPHAPGKGFLLSIPRDTWVDIPGRGTQKINAAYNYGPTTLIKTIQQDFGVKIHHYLEVGFVTFAEIVNAIGQVQVFFPTEAYDKYTGLNITTPGCVGLNGLEALTYVRSRHYHHKAAGSGSNPLEWPEEDTDFGRIRRQQYFMRSLAQEAISKGAKNPFTAKALLKKTISHLVRDKDMSLSDFLSLVRAFRSVDPVAVQMETLPTTSAEIFPDGVRTDVELVQESKAAPLFAQLGTFASTQPQKETPLPKIPHGQIRVQVLNGSGVNGIAGTTQSALLAHGFASGGAPGDADRHSYDATEVRYAPGDLDKARVVASYLGGAGKLVVVPGAADRSPIVVVVDRDFQAVAPPVSHPATTTTTIQPANPGTTPGVTVPRSEPGMPLVGCG